MEKMKRNFLNNIRDAKRMLCIALCVVMTLLLIGCGESASAVSGTKQDVANTKAAANTIQGNQPTPVDIDYSLERYNLIRRAYWVNGQREKANSLICQVEKPLGYVVLFAGNAAVGNFVVDGKVSSLNSLKNSFVWDGNIPKDILSTLPYITGG